MRKNFLFLTFISYFFIGFVQAQDITFNNSVPTDVSVCAEGETFTVSFTNDSPGSLSSLSIQVALPTGINYDGNLIETSSYNVQEQNTSNSAALLFSANDLPAGQTITFSFDMSAGFVAMTNHQGGYVFRNNVTVNYNGSSTTEQSDAYNIIYPALSIIDVNPLANSVFVGEIFTRTVKVINGGFGKLSSFTLNDIHNANINLLSVDVGTLNGAMDAIEFTGTDFQSVGNGDAWLDRNESIEVIQTLQVVGCEDVTSQLVAVWGCDGETENSNLEFPHSSVQLFLPNLSVSSTPTFNTCVDGSPDAQQLTITNNGNGPANNMVVAISNNETYQFSKVNENSVTYQLNGGAWTNLTPVSTTTAYANGEYSCLGVGAKKGFAVELPNLQPGDSYNIVWDNYTCPTDYCGAVNLIGWNYKLTYEDACQSNSYEDSTVVQATKDKNFNIFVENPADLSDGQTGEYKFIISSATFDLPEGTNPYFEAIFDIPVGLDWSGNASDLTFLSGTTPWAPTSLTFANQKLTAKYDFPIPFQLTRSEFTLKLTANCAVSSSGTHTVGLQTNYGMDDSCSPVYEIPLHCYESAVTFLHCPGNCSEGLAFNGFSVGRTSFGLPDNDRDGLPDASGSLNMNNIKAQRVMVGDTFATTFSGTVKTSSNYPSWQYGFAASTLPNGDKLTLIGATISVYDQSTGQTLTCNNVDFTDDGSSPMKAEFDFSIATLVANSCSDFVGFVFEDGDEITLTPSYKVTGNIGNAIEQVLITNEFYLSDIPDPTQGSNKFYCSNWSGNLTMIGYYFTTQKNEDHDVNDCEKTISQSYYLSIGDCCTNYAGGDLFPYEYRNWAHVKSLTVEIPDGYSVSQMWMEQYRTRFTNGTVKETISEITPTSVVNNTYSFDLSQYFSINGGTLNLSDDGFSGTVYFKIAPDCQMTDGVYFPMTWDYTFMESDFLSGTETSAYTGTDQVRYNQANMRISSTLPVVNGIEPTVSWEVKIRNASAKVTADNSWMHLYAPSWDIDILEVKDLSTNTVLTKVGDFYQLGDIGTKKTKKYQITASYDRCELDELIVYSGYSCTGYETLFANTYCDYKSYTLSVNPQPASMQVRIEGSVNPADPCDNIVSAQVNMLSTKLGYVKDLWMEVEVPSSQSILLVNGSIEKEYPVGNTPANLSTPTLNNNVYYFSTADIDATIAAEGLVGVSDITANELFLNFDLELQNNFVNGDRVEIRVGGWEACGDSIPTFSLQYDPNAIFDQLTGIGLDDLDDTWGVAWGDYDNDGDPDVFVTNYVDNEPNRLYRNNGNSTFTRITSGDIVTDLASSIGATWGDYDNDGYVDLYVTNNIGYNNFLYRNNGDGTFTSIQNDPIVNEKSYSHGVSWGDYDNDGFLDLFVAEYFSTKFNLVYHNNGDGTFTRAASNSVATEASSSVAGIWGDYDDDGDIDLFVCNTNDENNSLYQNEGNGNFTKVTSGAIVSDGGKSVGASWGDIDNDGDLDLFVANAGDQDNFLYINNGDGSFTKETNSLVTTSGGNSHGSSFVDFDNDGDLDLYVSNDNEENNFLYANDGGGTFTAIQNSITSDGGNSLGAAWADFDKDGDLDLFVANHEAASSNYFYENERGSCYSNACVVLVGTNSNASGIGAKIKMLANIYGSSVWQTRYVSGQTGGGVSGQNDLAQHFGLGDAGMIDSIIVEWPSGYTQVLTNVNINDCITITEDSAAKICGVAYYDANGNCSYDAGDVLLANAKINLQPTGVSTYSNEDGYYSFYVKPGSYTIESEDFGSWELTCPASGTEYFAFISFPGQEFCNYDFGFIPGGVCAGMPDLSVGMATTDLRVGFENLLTIQYNNNGTATAENTSLVVDFGPDVKPIEASIPWTSSNGNIYTWDLGTLGIGTRNTIFIKDSVLATGVIGELATLTANISSSNTDCSAADNAFTLTSEFTGAIDPNDILVSPEGFIDDDQVLTYKIRFQNVGNSPVEFVRVIDQLPEELDLETLEIGMASHTFRFSSDEDGLLVWEFDNINLPDSTTNEVESHGFILFRVKPIRGLSPGTDIKNNAEIFFDVQDPVITNTVVNTIREEGNKPSGKLFITPNPMTDHSKIEISPRNATADIMIKEVRVFNMLGQLVFKEEQQEAFTYQLNRQFLGPGCYLIHATGDDGKPYSGKLLIK